MDFIGVVTITLKFLVATLPFFFYWLGYSRGKKAGYQKGVNDERQNTDKRIANLAYKLDARPDFGVSMPNAWGQAPKADTAVRVVTDGTTTGWGENGEYPVSDQRRQDEG